VYVKQTEYPRTGIIPRDEIIISTYKENKITGKCYGVPSDLRSVAREDDIKAEYLFKGAEMNILNWGKFKNPPREKTASTNAVSKKQESRWLQEVQMRTTVHHKPDCAKRNSQLP
jgi:hypothetical protein